MARHGLSTAQQNVVNGQKIIPLRAYVNALSYEGADLDPDQPLSQRYYRERFTFGRVYPQIFSEKENGTEPCAMQTECLFQARSESPGLKITLGFLQPIARGVDVSEKILEISPEHAGFRFQSPPLFEVAGKTFRAWMETVERKISIKVNDFRVSSRMFFAFPVSESRKTIQNENGGIAAVIFRSHEILEGRIETRIIRLQDDLFKICVRVVNQSFIREDDAEFPEKVMLRTFVSTHFALEAEGGEFVSLFEAPPDLKDFVDDCKNIGCWPLLLDDGKVILASSPMVPDDHPQIAAESTREVFEGA
jgi:hypothetical protein